MEKLFNFTSAQLLKEWLQATYYQEILARLEVIAVGLEGLEVLINLKGVYPQLEVGYIHYENLGYLPDWNGNKVSQNFTYLPLITDVQIIGSGSYRVGPVDTSLLYEVLNCFSKDVVIIGSMCDAILMKMLEFYAFSQKRLLLRRPLYFETSSLRDSINKYLRFSNVPLNIKVIDTNRMNRYFRQLGEKRLMIGIHEEMMAHWYAHLIQLLDLPASEYFDEPRLRLEACLY